MSEPDLVERLLTGAGGLFGGGHANAVTVPLLGRRSVFLAEGNAHEHRRRLIGEVLTGATAATANRAAALVEADIGEWPVSRPFPLMLRLRSLLLRAQLPPLPAGTTVMAAIPLVHRRTEMFREPERFWPDRFLKRPVPGSPSWLPFGMGPRRCLGNELAPSVMAEVLDRIVRLVRLEPGWPGDERQRLLATIIVPGGGCLVRVAEHRTR